MPGFASVRGRLIQSLLREGVNPLIDSIVKDLKVRRYSFLGKTSESEPKSAD